MSEAREVKASSRNNLLVVICVALIVLVISLTILFFIRESKEKDSSRARSEQIISKVERLYVVPANEVPTVAEILDTKSLPKDQKFYDGAQNGDYLLVYNKSKVAILYRESINKLVRVSPVVPTENPGQATQGTP